MRAAQSQRSRPQNFSRQFSAAGYFIGFGLGGFFDGILLHQVLQWHHLLSLVDNPAIQDIRTQILADGLFHVLMYIIAVLGLIFLWKMRHEFAERSAGRWLFGSVLLGFGLWNVTDVGLFHWILQIHRVRVESDHPLFWDLLWLAVFGLAFLIAGWLIRSGAGSANGPGIKRHTLVVLVVSGAVMTAGAVAALPPSDAHATLVLFRSGATPKQVFQAFDAADAKILWADRSGSVWAVQVNGLSKASRMYRHGALLVSNSAIALGCFSWLRI
jgi:uncharacterized membrane protein